MRLPLLAAAVVLTAVPAEADVAQDRKACVKALGDKSSPAERRAACRRLIATGRYKGRELAVLWTNLGSSYWAAGDYRKAVELHGKAIEADPTDARAWQSRGVNYWQLKQYGRALADLNRAIRLNPRHAIALNNRCSLYEELKAYRRAVRDCRRSIRIKPDAWNTNDLAWTYYRMGQPKRGLLWANRAVALGPRRASVYDTRGHIYAALGRRAAAIRDFRKAIALSDDPETTKSSKEGLAKLGVRP